MRFIYLLLLLCCMVPLACFKSEVEVEVEPLTPEHLNIALSFLGTTDDGKNSGPEVDRFLRSVRLPTGNPWCAAFVSFCLEEASVTLPAVRSGLARHFLTREAMIAEHVKRTNTTLEPGTIVGWKRGNTQFGHLGFVKEWSGRCGKTIEGNTSQPGHAGSEFNGGGVWIKERCIEPLAHFRITWFTPVTY